MTEKVAMESLRFNLEACFTYLDFPRETWSKIRTTNICKENLENLENLDAG